MKERPFAKEADTARDQRSAGSVASGREVIPPRGAPGAPPGIAGHGEGGTGGTADTPPADERLDLKGRWRAVHHLQFWWVAGHHMLLPCRDEREAQRRLERLREDWDEPCAVAGE